MHVATKDILGYDLDIRFKMTHVELIRDENNSLFWAPMCEKPSPASFCSTRTICTISRIEEGRTGAERYQELVSEYATRTLADEPSRIVGQRRALEKALNSFNLKCDLPGNRYVRRVVGRLAFKALQDIHTAQPEKVRASVPGRISPDVFDDNE